MNTSHSLIFFSLSAVCLFGLFFVTLFSLVVRRERLQMLKEISRSHSIFIRVFTFFFKEQNLETLLFSISCSQHILRLFFVIFSSALFFHSEILADYLAFDIWKSPLEFLKIALFIIFLLFCFIVFADLGPRTWVIFSQKTAKNALKPIAYFFVLIFLPISYCLFATLKLIFPHSPLTPYKEPASIQKEKILELISEDETKDYLNEHEKVLMQSVLAFRDRIVREIMVPRVELFALPSDTSIRKAASSLEKEGYSRIPVYKNTVDNIIGILMYKDVLSKYMESERSDAGPKLLEAPIESITKPVLYTPETKKISLLLQEFRKKQSHIAVVVDEYGGTQGIITIEDILEELVGEISDEYDTEQQLFRPAGKGSFIVDARMNLLDLEEELAIKIPQEGEYDTIAGYLSFLLQTIPQKGAVISLDDFEIEILDSSDRSVEKVKITPLKGERLKNKELQQKEVV